MRQVQRLGSSAAILCSVLLLLLLHSSSGQDDTVFNAVAGLPELSTYLAALKHCPGLLEEAKNTSTARTFFAPNNKAFTAYLKKLKLSSTAFLAPKNRAALQRLLQYHTGAEAYMMSIAATNKKQKLRTLLTNATVTLQLVKDKIMVNTAVVVEPDFPAGDSYLQVISQVLTPPAVKNATAAPAPTGRRLLLG